MQNTDDPEMFSGIRPCLGIYLIGSGSFRILIPSLNNSLFETSCMECVKGTDGEKTPGGVSASQGFQWQIWLLLFLSCFYLPFQELLCTLSCYLQEDLEGSIFF